ncbi:MULTISPECIES: multidrug efflux SMR transporter [unclassified Diaminobutyricimonas]|uniref:DMT family transporter n=1 Tax=unclassified Diaminobutyricimonas TaxID=2643261 RepID=UPI0012F4BC16|nr:MULTISPECIES: multidrug efflux SMR transporter [unclassified Diaminobutyricimonas]
MAWFILLLSAVFEAVWATALGYSNGFTELVPTIVFAIALTASMFGLGWAMKQIPIGTAYAVWVGVGAALTVSYAMLAGDEAFSIWKALFIGGIIVAVIGLKLARPPKRADSLDEETRGNEVAGSVESRR